MAIHDIELDGDLEKVETQQERKARIQQKEHRLDVTRVFYPGDIIVNGKTPYNLRHIRTEFDKVFKTLFPKEDPCYQFVELNTDQNETSIQVWAVDHKLDDLVKATLETAKVFYSSIDTDQYDIINPIFIADELLLQPIFKS